LVASAPALMSELGCMTLNRCRGAPRIVIQH
jgi:hypothetical protein